MTEPAVVNPWYKEPWPWMILGLLSLGIVAGSSIAFIGLTNPPEMVTGEYERLGRGLTDTATRTGQARSLGLFGQVGLEDDRVVLEINAHDLDALPEPLLIRFQHPATSDGDSSVVLEREYHGRYAGHLTVPPHDRAQVIVADLAQTWWLSGRRGETDDVIALEPKRL